MNLKTKPPATPPTRTMPKRDFLPTNLELAKSKRDLLRMRAVGKNLLPLFAVVVRSLY